MLVEEWIHRCYSLQSWQYSYNPLSSLCYHYDALMHSLIAFTFILIHLHWVHKSPLFQGITDSLELRQYVGIFYQTKIDSHYKYFLLLNMKWEILASTLPNHYRNLMKKMKEKTWNSLIRLLNSLIVNSLIFVFLQVAYFKDEQDNCFIILPATNCTGNRQGW